MITMFITFDPGAIAGILADLAINIATYAGIAALLYSIGGILIRTISWTFDKLLINFIGMFYKYFEIIINGELLSDSVVSGMMNRVYLLVGVFVVFRLGMLLVNYIINPSEVMDEKVGVSALVKRVIIGLILMIFMPQIFGYAFRLQKAILQDQIIEQVIMSEDEFIQVESYKERHGMGKIIGMTVFRGFFDLAPKAAKKANVKNNFDKATMIEKEYDLSIIDDVGIGLSSGILHETGGDYSHNYFPIFSTVVLGFVLYKLVQYCLDAVVRSFKLSLLQVIAPICIVEYMINSDRNEVFKSWRKAVISTFLMLFLRVASIWFVAYVTMLMQPGMTDSSSLLQTGDNLLKAIIVLGLLAFMMDFPKILSDVFGMDLDQSGSVKNVMGKAMGAAAAGLAIGGAVAGFGMKAAGATRGTIKGGLTKLAGKDSAFAKGLNGGLGTKMGAMAGVTAAGIGALAGKAKNGGSLKSNYAKSAATLSKGVDKVKNSKAGQIGAEFAAAAKESHLGDTLKTGAMAVGGALLASNAVTKSASGGYQQVSGAVDQKIKGKEQQQAEQAYREHQMEVTDNISARVSTNFSEVADLNNKIDELIKKAPNGGSISTDSTVAVDNNVSFTQGATTTHGTTTMTYSDGTALPDMDLGDFGRYTTHRESRSEETGMQQRINDIVHVHDESSPTELADRVKNSAFGLMSDDQFSAMEEKALKKHAEKKKQDQ